MANAKLEDPAVESLKAPELKGGKPKIPDGGWGWIVVLSSFLISMIADGVSFSFGLLYIEFLQAFGESKSLTSWIGSLFMSVPLITGPIMSALVDKYGCRKMTIWGGLISTTGFVISALFVNSISVMLVTFGVVAGLGLGLCYVTAVVSIAYWFDTKRTLATGLGASGTGLGTFIYAPMTQFFIETYGWRGCILLLAGSFANFCVCGCLMKEPDWILEENSKTDSTSEIDPDDFNADLETIRHNLAQSKNGEFLCDNLSSRIKEGKFGNLQADQCRSDYCLPTFIKRQEKVPFETLEMLKSNRKMYRIVLENYPNLLLCRSMSDKGLNNPSDEVVRVPITLALKFKKTHNSKLIHQNSLPVEPLHEPLLERKTSLEEKLVFGRGAHKPRNGSFYQCLRLHRNSIMYRGAMLNIHKYRMRASSCPNIYRNSMTTIAKDHTQKWYTEFCDLVKGMLDFSLFLELHFLLMSLSTILLFIWFIVPYFYLAEHMTRFGYTESEASFVISVIGITNTISMVALGWAGDQPWMNISKTYCVCLILCGISCTGMMIFTENYVMLLVSSALFGLFFGSSFSFTPAILVELVPLDRFTTAYGLTLMCQGIGNLLGPPIGGLCFDLTNTWDMSFYQAGFWIVISGVFIGFIPVTKNRKIFGSGPVEKEIESTKEKDYCNA